MYGRGRGRGSGFQGRSRGGSRQLEQPPAPEVSPVKPKRRTREKLTLETLFSTHGLPKYPIEFNKLKLGGKGNEFKDLKIIMDKYEALAMQISALPFDEFIYQAEKLCGSAKGRLRLHFLRQGTSDDSQFQAPLGARPDQPPAAVAAHNADDSLRDEDIAAAEAEAMEIAQQSAHTRTPSYSHDTHVPTATTTTTASSSTSSTSFSASLSAEALAKIEANRRLALERRRQRESMATGAQTAAQPPDGNTASSSFSASSSSVSSHVSSSSSSSSTTSTSSSSSAPPAPSADDPFASDADYALYEAAAALLPPAKTEQATAHTSDAADDVQEQ